MQHINHFSATLIVWIAAAPVLACAAIVGCADAATDETQFSTEIRAVNFAALGAGDDALACG
jgi:hypothetical protein